MMNSWRLFQSVILLGESLTNPIFIRETDRTPGWYQIVTWIVKRPLLSLGLIGLAGFVSITVALYFRNWYIFLLFPELLLMTITAIVLAPIIAEERVKGTWESLLVVLPGVREVLVSKVAGILWWIHPLLLFMALLLGAASIGIGILSLTVVPTRLPGMGTTPFFVLCLGVITLPIASSILFIVDRVQQYMLTITTTVAIGAAPSVTQISQFAAITSVMAAWLVESTFTGLVMLVVGGDGAAFSGEGILTIVTMGPFVSYMVNLTLIEALACTAFTLLVREVGVRGLWWWAVHRARRIV